MNSTSTNGTMAAYAGYLSTGLLLALALFYILRVDIYTLGGDQMRWVDLIDKMFLGTLRLSDLWASHGSHRAPAYKAIFLLNARYFNLNMQYEQILGAFAWAGAALMVVFGVRRHIGGMRPVVGALVFVTLPFLVINGHILQTVLGYSVISLRMLDMTCFLVIFYLLSRNLLAEPSLSRSALIATLLVVCSLFIGRGWGQGMLVTVLFVLGAYAIAERAVLTPARLYRTVLPTAVVAVVCILVYQAGIEYNEKRGVAGFSQILNISSLLSFAAMLFGRSLTFKHIDVAGGENVLIIQGVGVAVIGLYAVATFLFFKDKQYRRGWFPLALIGFSSAAALLVYLGRGAMTGEGWRGAAFPRHLAEVSVGLAGALVIIASYSKLGRSMQRGIAALSVLLILSQSAAIARTMYQTHFVIQHAEQRVRAFFGPVQSFSSPEAVKLAHCHTEAICVYVRDVVDRRALMERARQKAAAADG